MVNGRTASPVGENASGALSIFGEIGSGRSGIDTTGASLHTEEIPELRGEKAVKQYMQMRLNDATVSALVFAVKMVMRSLTYNVEPPEDAEEDDPDVQTYCEFGKQNLRDMEIDILDIVEDAIEAIVMGFEVDEVTYKRRLGPNPPTGMPASEFDDGLIGWHKIAHRDQLGVRRWDVDEHGNILGLWHQVEDQEEVYLPIAKLFHFRPSRRGNDPQGLSWLRGVWRGWTYKHKIEWIEATMLERGGAGYPVVEMPQGANTAEGSADMTRSKALVRDVRQDTYAGIVLPPPTAAGPDWEAHRWKFSFVSPDSSVGSLTDTAIRRYMVEIATGLLAHFLLLSVQQRGAYALSRDQRDLWHLGMSGLSHTLTKQLTRQLLRPLFALNQAKFPRRELWPKIVPSDIAQHDIEKVQSFITAMVGANIMDVSPEDRDRVRSMIGFPPETKDQRDSMDEAEADRAAIVPPGAPGGPSIPPPDQNEFSEAERAVGKRSHEWTAEDAWAAAMALEAIEG